jgi:Holliday junction resolvase-like predicted endonuclease
MRNGSETSSLIRLFIGEHVQHRSEYVCLKEIWRALAKKERWAYVFVNIHLSGRQIDLVVFTERTTVVVEVKGYLHPVRGGLNGPWEQVCPHGTRKIRNAYNQALDAKNALRDEIQRNIQVVGYPNSLVAIAPNIPKGSSITSDFKVVISELAQLEYELDRPSDALLTQEQCESLARRLGLEEIGLVEAAIDEELLDAERIFKSYASSFRDCYKPLAEVLIPDEYSYSDVRLGLQEVQLLVHTGNSSFQIRGPSGCGKTLLTMSCALSCFEAGCVPIFAAGHNFEGDFKRLLDKDAALLDLHSASQIIKAAKLLGKRVVIFLDGYNECRENLRSILTRSLRAFALRYDAGIVLSTQENIERPELLSTQTVLVNRPSDELKAAIAKIPHNDTNVNFRSLLQATGSGLEAALVGQVGTVMPYGASKFGLFDTYVRTKLRGVASEGIRILASFAEMLVQRACFSLTVREFDRLFDGTARIHLDQQRLVDAKLLHVRGDRIGFVHEMFFSAFAAEAVIRAAGGDVANIRTALESPRFFSSTVLILGAIDDENLLEAVLNGLTDQALLTACYHGECGEAAQSVVQRKIARMLESMVLQAHDLDFRFTGETWYAVEVAAKSDYLELENFGSYLGVIGCGLMSGQHIDAVMAACQAMDNAILEFTTVHAVEAKAKRVRLRHDIFSAAYVISPRVAISQLISFVHNGGLSFRHRDQAPGFGVAIRNAWPRAETAGQSYFLLGLTRFTVQNKVGAPYVARLLGNLTAHPYHLQLGVIDFAGYLRNVEQAMRIEIVQALQASLDKLGPMMNTIIFEALNGLGALEEEAKSYVSVIQAEIRCALEGDGYEADSAAWRLFSCQFDHPYDAAYFEEIQRLDENCKKRLLVKACRGADGQLLLFLGSLIKELCDFRDPDIAPAIARWTALPSRANFIEQAAVEVFFRAHEALGQLGADLPVLRGTVTNEADQAMLACGELFYWASRADVGNAEASHDTLVARSTLLKDCQHTAADALQLTASWLLSADGTRASLVEKYPALSGEICRRALERRQEQISYFGNGLNSAPGTIARFAVQVLGETGGPEDLRVLRSLCDDEQCGKSALNAIKHIEERYRFPNG